MCRREYYVLLDTYMCIEQYLRRNGYAATIINQTAHYPSIYPCFLLGNVSNSKYTGFYPLMAKKP